MQFDGATKKLIEQLGSRDEILHFSESSTGCEFDTTLFDILVAESELNKNLTKNKIATVNDFFDYIPGFDNRVVDRIIDYPTVFSQGWCELCFEYIQNDGGWMWVEVIVTQKVRKDSITFRLVFDILPCYKAGCCNYCEHAPLRVRGDIRGWL